MNGTQACNEIMQQVRKVISGKDEIIRKVMTAVVAGGHILIEDIPGVGKTTMAKAFAEAMSLKNRRIQFTTDVMPSDITGFTMFDKMKNDFVYKPGAVACNLLLADEINRTSSKTQSALLEVMEEGRVTVDGQTKTVPNPFLVIATQNPIGSVGTTLLPESQLDRFMICMNMGYPDMAHEIAMIQSRQEQTDILKDVRKVINKEDLILIQQEASDVFVHEHVISYIVNLVHLTRNSPDIELGVSPRGTLAITKAAKACAYIEGRDYVVPDDVRGILYDCINHRIILSAKAKTQGVKIKNIVEDILNKTAPET